MKLILARHGETEENLKGLIQGWLQGRLTKKGLIQAKNLGLQLKKYDLELIFSSDLDRCVKTAQEIFKTNKTKKLILTKLLRERSYGEFEGKVVTLKDLEALPGGFYHGKPANGESLYDVYLRLKTFYSKLKDYQVNTIAIVTHNGPIRISQLIINNKPLEELPSVHGIDNASFLKLEF
ncbi:histidine phosphatase family protein [Candidatus Woesearchaeota archaeon]|nr:hypothetical protein [uncultured archaeon]AQS32274.1 hypothetical protein [uncultured archaeon]MBS3149390.1 histidine phosphatase family protein [Candidatus Woesearchaeota archaeon]